MNIKIFTAWVAVFLISICSPAQRVDSLLSLLSGQRGSERIETLYQLSRNCERENPRLCLSYSREGYMMAVHYGDSLGMVQNGWMMGSALLRLQKIDSATGVFSKIVPIARRKEYKKLSLLLNAAASAYLNHAHYDKALDCFFESLELRILARDTSAQVIVLTNIGIVYYKLKDYERALQLFLRCHDLQLKTGDFYDADQLMLNAGHASAYLGQHSNALAHVEKALSYCDGECSTNRYMQANFVRGLVHFDLGNLEVAEAFFLKSYSDSKSSGDFRFQLDNIDYLSQIYLREKRFVNAANYLKEGERVINGYNSFNLEKVKLYSRLSELYRGLNDYKRASDYQLKYASVRDSLYSEDLINNLMRIESNYLEKENLAKIASQRDIIVLNREIMRRQRNLNFLSAVIIGLIIIVLIILFKGYRRKREVNNLLDRKVQERTAELEVSRRELLKVLRQRDQQVMRTASLICEKVNTLKGLSNTAREELSDPVVYAYVDRIDNTAKQIDTYMRLMLNDSKEITTL